MDVIRHDSVEAFLARAQGFLEQDEATNGIVLGNCLRMKRFPERTETPPLLVTVEEGEATRLTAMMTPPYKLVHAAPKGAPMAALESLAHALHGWEVSVPGVMAADRLAASFAKRWTDATGRAASSAGMHQRLYQLTSVKELPSVAGHLRVATRDDVDLLADWMCGFTRDVFGDEVAVEEGRKRATTRIEYGELYLWEDGQPVSMAAKARPTTNGIAVNHVYTPQEFRERGYATACVGRLSQLLLDDGWGFCCLYADLANPTSNGIYQRIGYEPVCDFAEYAFETDLKDG